MLKSLKVSRNGTMATIAVGALLTGCLPTPSLVYSPAPNAVNGSNLAEVDVRIFAQDFRDGTPTIYFTANGQEPNLEDCDQPYVPGSAITLTQPTTLIAAYSNDNLTLNPARFEANYAVGGGSSDVSTNRDLLLDWLEYETAMTGWFFCEFNNCQQPGTANAVACNLGRACLPYTIRQYDAAGNQTGFAKMSIGSTDLGAQTGQTIIKYSNFRVTADASYMVASVFSNAPNGSPRIEFPENTPSPASSTSPIPANFEMTADGVVTGTFSFDGTVGEQRTSVPLVISGNLNGTINDNTTILNSVKTSGYYDVTCTDQGCGPGVETYVAPNWDFLPTESNVEDSCPQPFYMLANSGSTSCIAVREGALNSEGQAFVGTAVCDVTDPAQQFKIDVVDEGDANSRPGFRFKNGGRCITQNGTNAASSAANVFSMGSCVPDQGNTLRLIGSSASAMKLRDDKLLACAAQPSSGIGFLRNYSCGNVFADGWFWHVLKDGMVPALSPETLVQQNQ